VGNFLIVISSCDLEKEGIRFFQRGLKFAHDVKSQTPDSTVETSWARASVFLRHNGSGASIAQDPQTNSWLLIIGTWFHSSGYGYGHQAKLLERYLLAGPNQLARELDGFFVLAIGDGRTKELIVLTDAMGSCHAYSRSWKNLTALSGSSILLASLDTTNLDPIGCQEFLLGGVSYQNRTVFREVDKLAPATVFKYRDGVLKESERYWTIKQLTPELFGSAKAVDALWESLERVSRDILRDFPRVSCDLTGGYDSRALAAGFLGAGGAFATVVSGAKDNSDVVISDGLAGILGMEHLHLPMPEQLSFAQVQRAHTLTDGEFDPVEYAGILSIHEVLLQRYDISINGSYGGIARALWWELLAPQIGARKKLDAQRLARSRYVLPNVDTELFPLATRIDLGDHLAGVIERVNEGLSHFPNSIQMDHANLNMRIHRWQGRIASSTNQLWPCLSPFGLRSVLETVLQSDTWLRLRSNLVRRMLAKYQPRLADYPLDRGYPAAPVTWRNFYKFLPIVSHLGGRALSKLRRITFGPTFGKKPASGVQPFRLHLLQEKAVQDLLNPSTMRVMQLLDPEAVTRFLVRAHDHDFPFNAQWNRLLSLELTLRVLEGSSAATSTHLPEKIKHQASRAQ